MKRGLFIAFEGIDGCGKSTQIWKLAKHISNLSKYNHLTLTREPYKNTDIRKIVFKDNDPQSQAKKLAEMFINDRRVHVAELIGPNLKKGSHVITDRYSLSTLAYQATQGFPTWKLLEMHKGILIPDLVFLIDLPEKTAASRMKGDKNTRSKKHKFEKDKAFITKLRENYLKLATLNNHIVVVIDGTKTPDEIFEKQVKPAFDKLYSEKQAR